jgi:hypothetical protein
MAFYAEYVPNSINVPVAVQFRAGPIASGLDAATWLPRTR